MISAYVCEGSSVSQTCVKQRSILLLCALNIQIVNKNINIYFHTLLISKMTRSPNRSFDVCNQWINQWINNSINQSICLYSVLHTEKTLYVGSNSKWIRGGTWVYFIIFFVFVFLLLIKSSLHRLMVDALNGDNALKTRTIYGDRNLRKDCPGTSIGRYRP